MQPRTDRVMRTIRFSMPSCIFLLVAQPNKRPWALPTPIIHHVCSQTISARCFLHRFHLSRPKWVRIVHRTQPLKMPSGNQTNLLVVFDVLCLGVLVVVSLQCADPCVCGLCSEVASGHRQAGRRPGAWASFALLIIAKTVALLLRCTMATWVLLAQSCCRYCLPCNMLGEFVGLPMRSRFRALKLNLHLVS